jgi:hypothetical protein
MAVQSSFVHRIFHIHHSISNKIALTHKNKECNGRYDANSACFAIVEPFLHRLMCNSVCTKINMKLGQKIDTRIIYIETFPSTKYF